MKLLGHVLLFAVIMLALSSNSVGQSTANQKMALRRFVDGASKIAPQVRRHLSPAMRSYLEYAAAATNGRLDGRGTGVRRSTPLVDLRSSLIPVSNPTLDPANEGYTQNTSSSARCGRAVVVGYADSGATVRSNPGLALGAPISLANVSYSGDLGRAFVDIGFVNPGSFSANALLGEPVVTCSSPQTFQLASILNTTTPDGANPIIGPSISISSDGGKTWGDPLLTASLDGNTQMADQPWLAVDPSDAQRLYLSFTQIDFLGCVDIDVVSSANGGKTWNAPVFVDQECPFTQPAFGQNSVAGARVTVSPDGQVYVAYEFFPNLIPQTRQNNSIYFAKSFDHGATFGVPIKVADLVPSGDDSVQLNGGLIVDEYPQIAVDRSHKHSGGNIYITYPDGRDKIVPNTNSPTGIYAYPDIFVAKSINTGRSFTVLGALSPTPKDFTGIGRDQFLPTVAVDRDGVLAVCYYDRRNDPADLRVERFCSHSRNQGRAWLAEPELDLSWLPMFNIDPLGSFVGPGFGIGEYNTVTSDFLLKVDGFFDAFVIENNGNQDVVATMRGNSR